MSSVQIEQKSYEMPPREGLSIAHFLTVADIERSARYYEKVFGARILSLGDGNAPGYLQLANIWMILNVGGGPTPDKPTVTLSVPDPDHINSFMNFRVADIQACYELWKSRGAEFITEPIPKYGETRCYIRDPDGYIIEVGQSTDLTTVDARPGKSILTVPGELSSTRQLYRSKHFLVRYRQTPLSPAKNNIVLKLECHQARSRISSFYPLRPLQFGLADGGQSYLQGGWPLRLAQGQAGTEPRRQWYVLLLRLR
jgi:catechol 2,3-dioxygenase-like lactoylglutathione lyase family enzyme